MARSGGKPPKEALPSDADPARARGRAVTGCSFLVQYAQASGCPAVGWHGS